MVTLYSYVMTDDTGFAPNPYHGVLTLACCKPVIRRCANIGYWVMGTVGKTIINKVRKKLGWGEDYLGRIIYIAEITDKVTRNKYWNCIWFQKKKFAPNFPYCVGDNIYEPCAGDFKNPPPCAVHTADDKDRDLGKKNKARCNQSVLISDNFYYFGDSAVEIREDLRKEFISRRWKRIDGADKIGELIEHIKEMHASEKGILGDPINTYENRIS
jgi:hypothetical protein